MKILFFKPKHCTSLTFSHNSKLSFYNSQQPFQKHDLRDKTQVTCFKCLQTGHYANECEIPKGQAGPGYNNFSANRLGRGGANLGAAPINDEQRTEIQVARQAREGSKIVMKPWGDV